MSPESDRSARSPGSRPAEVLNLLGALAIASGLLVVAGRPLATDDTWWHLALGRSFRTSGPWLTSNPILHTTVSPPSPAAWLFDVLLHALSLPFGLAGLRIVHVALAVAIGWFAWIAFWRASRGSKGIASTAFAFFLVLSAYRIAQLRPELVTLLASILIYLWLVQDRGVPGWGRIGWAALLCGLWANLHPGFLVGPMLVALACVGTTLEVVMRVECDRGLLCARARRLACATAITLAATFLNPMGGAAHLLYFRAGEASPAMAIVADEWSRLEPFRLPSGDLPPSLLVWLLYWIVTVATIFLVARLARRWRSASHGSPGDDELDGALVPLALLGIAAPLFAVRFLWLAVFPLILLVHALRRIESPRNRMAWAMAASTWLLVPASVWIGDGPLLSTGISSATYRNAYHERKYHAGAVEFLRASGIEGNLYNSYFMGGFLGYQLAPALRVFIDGSLGVPPEVMTDYLSIQGNGTGSADSRITPVLDRYRVDTFVGIGLPTPESSDRPWRLTAFHLDGDPDWVLVYRDLRTAVHLRRGKRNSENLRRVQAHYQREGIPFDPDAGLPVAEILERVPEWAIRHGLVPRDFESLRRAAWSEPIRVRAVARLAATYLALGLDEHAIAVDDRLIRANPTAQAPRRRRIGALLRLDRLEDAIDEAEELEGLRPADGLSLRLIADTKHFPDLDPAERRRRASLLAVLSRAEARRLTSSTLVGTSSAPVQPSNGRR